MTDQDARHWADLIRAYPEAGAGILIVSVVIGLAINYSWWLIALPDLINAHSDSRLMTAFFASFGVVLVDTVAAFRAVRFANAINNAIKSKECGNDDEA